MKNIKETNTVIYVILTLVLAVIFGSLFIDSEKSTQTENHIEAINGTSL
jgi:hypothetical protein